MRIKTIKLFNFEELDDKAKERARDWYREHALDYEWYDGIYEDARRIGLKITAFDLGRSQSLDAKFIASAEETAHKIEKEHGETCKTFKTAKDYLEQRDRVINEAVKDENGDFAEQNELDDALDSLDKEFLYQLQQDYWHMLEREMEYLLSDESVDESIVANEYEFTEEGKIA